MLIEEIELALKVFQYKNYEIGLAALAYLLWELVTGVQLAYTITIAFRHCGSSFHSKLRRWKSEAERKLV